MGLRDLALVSIVSVLALAAIGKPWIGVLGWNWISFMNPHRLTWTLRDLPVAQILGIATLVGLLFTRERRAPPLKAETALMIALAVLFCLSTLFAWERDAALLYLDRVLKIYLFVFVTLMLIYSFERVRWLYIVTILSIGFYGFKGGIFAIITGGSYRVWGPPDSFIEDNNSLGLAMTMVLPMLLFSARAETSKWVRRGLYAVFWLSIPAILFTYSRGAFLAIAVMGVVLALQYRKGLILLIVIASIAFVSTPFIVPEQWLARQQSILEYEEDHSAMTRLQAWGVAWNVALENPVLGAGFNFNYAEDERWLAYAPFVEPWASNARAAHSIYFQVLGQHGFLGLGLFLSLMAVTYVRLGGLYRRCRDPATVWIGLYARGAQLALIPYAVAGAFLSLAYFDLFYACVALSVILHREWQLAGESIPSENTAAHPTESVGSS